MPEPFHPEQGGSYQVSNETLIEDQTGPCKVFLVQNDGNYDYAHFDPSQKQEMFAWIKAKQQEGKEVRSIGPNQTIQGSVDTVYEAANTIGKVPKRWKR